MTIYYTCNIPDTYVIKMSNRWYAEPDKVVIGSLSFALEGVEAWQARTLSMYNRRTRFE